MHERSMVLSLLSHDDWANENSWITVIQLYFL